MTVLIPLVLLLAVLVTAYYSQVSFWLTLYLRNPIKEAFWLTLRRSPRLMKFLSDRGRSRRRKVRKSLVLRAGLQEFISDLSRKIKADLLCPENVEVLENEGESLCLQLYRDQFRAVIEILRPAEIMVRYWVERNELESIRISFKTGPGNKVLVEVHALEPQRFHQPIGTSIEAFLGGLPYRKVRQPGPRVIGIWALNE